MSFGLTDRTRMDQEITAGGITTIRKKKQKGTIGLRMTATNSKGSLILPCGVKDMKTRLFAKHLIPNKIAAGLLIILALVAIKYIPSVAAMPAFLALVLAPALIFSKENYIDIGGPTNEIR